MLKSVCPECGRAFEPDRHSGSCPECRPRDKGVKDKYVRGNRHARGYGYRWEKLSRRARRLQPFCSDCGRTDHLTADHSVAAWQAFEQGKPITLDMIDVVCRWCNADRGAARGVNASDEYRGGGSQVEILEAWLEESSSAADDVSRETFE